MFLHITGCSIKRNLAVLFVVSDECGYCSDIITSSIDLYEKHKNRVEFISYYENDSTELLWQLKEFGIKNSLDVPWKKIYNADSLIKQLPIDEGKPQILFYKDGKLKHIISGYSKHVEHQIDSTISSILIE